MLSNITIKMRLIATMSVLGLLIAVLGAMSMIGLKSANSSLNEVYSNQLASMQAIGESQISLGRARFTMDRVMVHPEAADAKDTLVRAEQFLEALPGLAAKRGRKKHVRRHGQEARRVHQ